MTISESPDRVDSLLDLRPGDRWPGLIASMIDDEDPRRGVLVLSGRIGPDAVPRIEDHVGDLLRRDVRDITVDATALVEAPTELLDLLLRTQSTLGPRRGLLRLFGLRAEVVATPPESATHDPVIAARPAS